MRDTTPAPAHQIDSLQTKLGRSHLLRLLTALVLAIGTWGWVTQATDPINRTTFSDVEIEQAELEDGLTLITTLPRGRVTVEGPRSQIGEINRSNLSLSLDTTEVDGPGDYRLPVVVEAPDTSARISVVPEHVQVQVDEITSKVVPIEVERPDTNPANRVTSGIQPEVSQVTVSGPSIAVDRVAKVILPVTVTTQNTSFTEVFIPYAIDANGQRVSEVSILPVEVLTRVDLQSRGKVVSVIANVTGSPAEGYSANQKTVLPTSITVEGPEEVLQTLLFVNTEPVDITGASQSVSQRVGLEDLPPGVTVVEPASGQVEVRVAIQDSSSTSQTLPNLPVSALNVPGGYEVTIEPQSVDVVVMGPLSTLQAMTAEDINVFVDVRGLEPGSYDLTPFVALTDGNVRTDGTNPERVQVTIQEEDSGTPTAPIPVSPQIVPVDSLMPSDNRTVKRGKRARD